MSETKSGGGKLIGRSVHWVAGDSKRVKPSIVGGRNALFMGFRSPATVAEVRHLLLKLPVGLRLESGRCRFRGLDEEITFARY